MRAASHAAESPIGDFVSLTRPYHARLLRVAGALCGDPDQAADLTQETLVRAFQSFARFDRARPILPWLMRILRNHYLDTLKTGRCRYEVAAYQMGGDGRDPYSGRASGEPGPHELVERGRLGSWLTAEVAALDQKHRLVILLCDVEGLSYEEAAEALGVPVGTIRSRLSRCRRTLRERYRERMHAEATPVPKQMLARKKP